MLAPFKWNNFTAIIKDNKGKAEILRKLEIVAQTILVLKVLRIFKCSNRISSDSNFHLNCHTGDLCWLVGWQKCDKLYFHFIHYRAAVM